MNRNAIWKIAETTHEHYLIGAVTIITEDGQVVHQIHDLQLGEQIIREHNAHAGLLEQTEKHVALLEALLEDELDRTEDNTTKVQNLRHEIAWAKAAKAKAL